MRSIHPGSEQLSEYVDGELEPSQCEALEVHLLQCEECGEELVALRQLVARATALPDREPEHDLWPGIRGRLAARALPRAGSASAEAVEPLGRGRSASTGPGGRRAAAGSRRRRLVLSVPQLLAAAIALIVLSAGTAWIALGAGGGAEAAPLPVAQAAPATEPVGPPVFTASYQAAVTELERELDLRRSDLDPETVRVVERNLAIIDAAIAEARQALENDPGSGFLHSHLAGAMQQKVELLRQATRLGQSEI